MSSRLLNPRAVNAALKLLITTLLPLKVLGLRVSLITSRFSSRSSFRVFVARDITHHLALTRQPTLLVLAPDLLA